ncbi:MAG: Nramp family divalent metal transporter [Myxococcota bacterium]
MLPAPEAAPLPEAPPLRRMLGPSIVLVGLSIGSGEFVLWPRLTAEWGFVLFWACWVGVTLQFFLNMEIERWTLATGESAVIGFVRLHRALAPVFFVCATVPWVWPGWATGAATLVSWEFGGSVPWMAAASLVLCGVVLSVGPVVYRTVETIQLVLVGIIAVAAVVLALAVVEGSHVAALADGAWRVGTVPDGVHWPMLLGALAFAGVGGTGNLTQSNYVKDKGYGMGAYIGRITSPLTGRDEATGVVGRVIGGSDEDFARWRVWWRRTNLEHFCSFYVLALGTLALFCLLAAALLEPGAPVGAEFDFLDAEASAIGERFGEAGRLGFLFLGVAVLFSTELALLDSVARVSSDVLAFWLERRVAASRLYFAAVWTLIAFGIFVLILGFDQPLTLIVLSAALNGIVMFVYSGLLLVLNTTSLRPPLRPSPLRIGALVLTFLFFGYFSVVTLVDRLGGS